MSDTQAVLGAADQLGKLIAQHPAAQKLEAVIARLEKDTDAQRLLTDFNRHQETMAEKEATGQPVEVADKHKLRELQQGVAGHALLRELQVAQMDYVDLMRQVDERMGGGAGR